MTPEEIQKLLGGYATGTLTPVEQEALFEAALHDQELFDALAREQPLRDLLRDPAARAHVLAAIDERPRHWWQLGYRWVLVGAMLAACLVGAGVYWNRPKPVVRPILVAEVKPQELPQSTPPPPAAAPSTVAEPAHQSAIPSAPPGSERQTTAPRVGKARSAVRQFVPRVAPAPATPARAEAVVTGAVSPVPEVKLPLAADGTLALPKQEAPDLQKAQVQNARALFYGTPAAIPAGVAGSTFVPSETQPPQAPRFAMQAGVASVVFAPNLGVKWTALRRADNGLFSEVDPEQIKAGDTIKLRLVPNDNGFLSVLEGTKPLMAKQRAQRLQPVETPEITSEAGKKELTVMLARQAQPPAANLVRAASADQLSQTDRGEHAVYEVKMGNNQLAPVLVKITLNFQ